MIRFIGRLTLTIIITAMLVFGGLLVLTNDSVNAHTTGHVWEQDSIKPSIHLWVPEHHHY